jgi:hypothetical protein
VTAIGARSSHIRAGRDCGRRPALGVARASCRRITLPRSVRKPRTRASSFQLTIGPKQKLSRAGAVRPASSPLRQPGPRVLLWVRAVTKGNSRGRPRAAELGTGRAWMQK